MLDRAIADGHVEPRRDRRAGRRARRLLPQRAGDRCRTPRRTVARFQREQAANREVLLRPQFQLHGAAVALDRFDARARAQRATRCTSAPPAGASSTATATCAPNMCACCSRRWSSTASNSTPRCARSTPSTRSPFSASSARWPARRGSRRSSWPAAPRRWATRRRAALMPLYTAHRALLRARLADGPPARRRSRARRSSWPPLAQRYLARCALARPRCARPRRLERSARPRVVALPDRLREQRHRGDDPAACRPPAPPRGRRNGGTLSVTTHLRRSPRRPARRPPAPMNRPWAASAMTSRAPAWRSAAAARCIVLAAGDQVVEQQHRHAAHVAGHQVAAADTTPALRRLSTIAKPTGRASRCSSASRQSCARLTPPGSGEATATGPSPASVDAPRASKARCASRCSVGAAERVLRTPPRCAPRARSPAPCRPPRTAARRSAA